MYATENSLMWDCSAGGRLTLLGGRGRLGFEGWTGVQQMNKGEMRERFPIGKTEAVKEMQPAGFGRNYD